MIKFRKNVFETNSSSMHSIAIGNYDELSKPNYKYSITAYTNNFGWGYDELITPLEKLSYVLTSVKYHTYDKEDCKRYYKYICDMFSEYTGVKVKFGSKCKCEDEGEDEYEDWWCDCFGVIDHQSTDLLNDWWSDDEEELKNKMKELIFNNKYKIIIDSDNH